MKAFLKSLTLFDLNCVIKLGFVTLLPDSISLLPGLQSQHCLILSHNAAWSSAHIAA